MGGIVEEFLEGEETRSPSCQIRIDPRGRVILISTHDQMLGGPTNQLYLGCRFPAEDGYRRQIQELARRIGEVLAARGVVSRLGIDFVVRRASASALGDLRPRNQPADRGNDPSFSRAGVPDRRPARSRERALPLAERSRRSSTARPTTSGPTHTAV